MENIKIYEEFVFEAVLPACRIPWPQLCKMFKPGYNLGDFPFVGFIEEIPASGAIFGDKKGIQIWVEPDYTWTKWDSRGVGIESGTWTCMELPGGGTKINLVKKPA